MEIILNPNNTTQGAERFYRAIQDSSLLNVKGSRCVEIFCVKKMEVDGEMVEVCTAAAIGLMPQFPNWVHPMVDFCEDGHIVRSTQIDGGFMDGYPVKYGKPGLTKTDKTI